MATRAANAARFHNAGRVKRKGETKAQDFVKHYPATHLHVYNRLESRIVDILQYNSRPVYARLQSAGGSTTIALYRLEPGREAAAGENIRLYFEVKELEALCGSLEAAGVEITQRPKLMPWGWTHAYLNDPDGHEVSLYWAGVKRLRGSRPLVDVGQKHRAKQ